MLESIKEFLGIKTQKEKISDSVPETIYGFWDKKKEMPKYLLNQSHFIFYDKKGHVRVEFETGVKDVMASLREYDEDESWFIHMPLEHLWAGSGPSFRSFFKGNDYVVRASLPNKLKTGFSCRDYHAIVLRVSFLDELFSRLNELSTHEGGRCSLELISVPRKFKPSEKDIEKALG